VPSGTLSSVTSPQPDTPLARDRRVAAALTRLDVHRRYAEHHSPLGVADGRLLWLLSDGRPRTLREIGDALRLEQSTVNRQVNAALHAGLVRRIAEPGRSARLLEPTPAGLEAFEAATAKALGAYAVGLGALGPDTDAFLDLLDRFVAAYGEALRDAES
jgi:DNA-binding MarR family transcriptional regulator